MKKLFKRLMIIVTVVSLFTIQFNVIHPSATTKNIPQNNFRVWPGRPGGNGDGSEEYMNGLKYGEMRGPWKLLRTDYGKVSDLLENREKMKAIADTIISFSGIGNLISLAERLSIIVNKRDTRFDGSTYYKTETYGSGRRIKTVTTTYNNMRQYTGSFTEYLSY